MAIVIALERVSASIGTRQVLDDVSLGVRAGEMVALCGPNGAGKSSVIRAVAGLLATTSGRIALAGDPIASLTGRQRAVRLSYLPQERRLAWNMPAIEIVALALPFLSGAEARDRALRVLAEVEADQLAQRGVAELSGGERSRILIARALATDAEALALDEPVVGLDPDAQFLVMERLRRRAAAGQAVLLSLHDLGLASRYADRLVVVERGRVVADAPPIEALSPGVLHTTFRISGDWVDGQAGPTLVSSSPRSQGV